MIVSFHPCFVGDTNIICAGREPDDSDLAAIRKARAVILPQGCRPALYEMAAANCRHVFPNYEARFAYPGKLEQLRLFRETRTPHPATRLFPHTRAWFEKYPTGQGPERPALPLVFKFDWGGEGETVFRIESRETLDNIIELAVSYEKTGQSGFLTQELITCHPRALRVVVAGKRLLSYWRVQPHQDRFTTSMSHGAVIDGDDAPELQAMGRESVREFCKKTKIDLAGFDLLFPTDRPPVPLFLEINYFFGRRGLGGSDRWYTILNAEIERWLQTL